MKSRKPLPRADQGFLAVLKPSREAAELAGLLDKPCDWLEEVEKGGAKFTWKQADLGDLGVMLRDGIKNNRALSPRQRQDQLKALNQGDCEDARREWANRRAHAWQWVELVKLYGKHRERILRLPTLEHQKAAAHELERLHNGGNAEELARLGKAAERDKELAKQLREFERNEALAAARQGLAKWYVPMLRRFDRTSRVPRSAINPERTVRDYGTAVDRFWRDAYAQNPAWLQDDPADLRRRLLKDNRLALPEHPDEFVLVGVGAKDKQEGH